MWSTARAAARWICKHPSPASNEKPDAPRGVRFFSACQKTSAEMNPLTLGRGARGGDSPPRVGSNALNALHSKAFRERSENFPAAQRRESIGIPSPTAGAVGHAYQNF